MSDILKDTFETVYKEEYDALAKEGKTVGEIKVLLDKVLPMSRTILIKQGEAEDKA
ncbi:MAG: hypothetical protein IJ119_13485 [Clostridia bacterium]|nr:hypothetical protein [Clostridia bacterium]